jgi:hypothetical protein
VGSCFVAAGQTLCWVLHLVSCAERGRAIAVCEGEVVRVCVGGGGGQQNACVFSDVGVLGEGDLDLVNNACAQSLIVHPQHPVTQGSGPSQAEFWGHSDSTCPML